MIYGGETWAMLVENEEIGRTEVRMLRMMRVVRWQDRLTHADSQNTFGIKFTGNFVRSSTLHWFGHVERKPEYWVQKIMTFKEDIEGSNKQ